MAETRNTMDDGKAINLQGRARRTQTFSEAVADLRRERADKAGRLRLVENWRDFLPPGSLWYPGSPAKMDCPTCRGYGYMSFDLPILHPKFGKIFACDCWAGPAPVTL